MCGLKPFLRTWKPLRGWGVWVEGEARVEAGLKCGLKPFPRAWQESVRAEALSEGVEAPAGLGCVGGGARCAG